jgi:DNA-directed RNA polymerase III subunit RPC6
LHPEGIPDGDLAAKISHIPVTDRAVAINRLLSQRKLQIFKDGESLVYKEVKQDEAVKFKGLSSEDLLVYQIIQQSGNTGIWTKELKQKSNLPQTQIGKIFKSLEARKLIKAVKHVAQQNRKVYMLYELEPSREITGGAWYTEHEYDAEFIHVLREQCVKFILARGKVTLEDVCDFVKQTKLSHVDLGQEEVLQIVNTLVYDGKVDAHEELERDPERDPDDPAGDAGDDDDDLDYMENVIVVYRPASLPIPESSAFTAVPCGVCPVFQECAPGGLVSPETCQYMKDWLSF